MWMIFHSRNIGSMRGKKDGGSPRQLRGQASDARARLGVSLMPRSRQRKTKAERPRQAVVVSSTIARMPARTPDSPLGDRIAPAQAVVEAVGDVDAGVAVRALASLRPGPPPVATPARPDPGAR